MSTSDEYVTGLSDLVDRLNTLPLALGAQKNIIVRALRAGAVPIENRAHELAPVYQGLERFQMRRKKQYLLVPGQLRESMMTTVSDQTATGAVAKIGPGRPGFYGAFEEFGTDRQLAKPWLRPAFDEKLAEAVAIIGYTIGSEIEKELRKAA